MLARLAILIVSHNTRELTRACLRSVLEQPAGLKSQVIVVDNASADGSAAAVAAEFPEIRLLKLDRNLGFAAGNNLAARYARREWLLLLNPDTAVVDGAIDRLLAFVQAHPEDSIFGGRTVFADGSLNPTSCHGRPTPWSTFCIATGLARFFRHRPWANTEEIRGWNRDTVREVDAVTGCFLLIRRSLWEQLGGFDERFFMYGEETDLCLRARALGHKCLICPDATIIHHGGASEKVRSGKMVRLFTAKARLFARHWSPAAARFGVAMLDLWALTRLAAFAAAGLLRPSFREQYQTWRDIWRQRTAWHTAAREMHPLPRAVTAPQPQSEACANE